MEQSSASPLRTLRTARNPCSFPLPHVLHRNVQEPPLSYQESTCSLLSAAAQAWKRHAISSWQGEGMLLCYFSRHCSPEMPTKGNVHYWISFMFSVHTRTQWHSRYSTLYVVINFNKCQSIYTSILSQKEPFLVLIQHMHQKGTLVQLQKQSLAFFRKLINQSLALKCLLLWSRDSTEMFHQGIQG